VRTPDTMEVLHMSKKSDSDSSLSTTSRTLGKHGRLVNAGEMPPKGEAGKGTVILGQSWYHHLKRLEAKRQAEGRPTRH